MAIFDFKINRRIYREKTRGNLKMNENIETTNEEYAKPSTLKAWCENFWYHYKWQSLIALFLVFTITVCTLQMCKKEDYDVYVLYGGGKYISRQVENGGFCEYDEITSSLKQVSRDFDENGKISISFLDKYMLSAEEIKAASGEVNHTLLNQNNEAFRDLMLSSPYYVCFLSDTLYLEYSRNIPTFSPLAGYVGENEVEYLDECAVYLRSLPFKDLPGISILPENTVICFKAKTAFSGYFGNEENDRQFKQSEEVIRNIFAYGQK